MGTDATAAKLLPVELQLLSLWQANSLLEIGPSDAEKLTGVSKGTLSPKLRAMAEAGFLIRQESGRYCLGPMLPGIFLAYVNRLFEQTSQARRMLDQILESSRLMQTIGTQMAAAAQGAQPPEEEQ